MPCSARLSNAAKLTHRALEFNKEAQQLTCRFKARDEVRAQLVGGGASGGVGPTKPAIKGARAVGACRREKGKRRRRLQLIIELGAINCSLCSSYCCYCCTFWMAAVAESCIAGLAQCIEVWSTLSSAASAAAAVAVAALLAHLQNEAEKYCN